MKLYMLRNKQTGKYFKSHKDRGCGLAYWHAIDGGTLWKRFAHVKQAISRNQDKFKIRDMEIVTLTASISCIESVGGGAV